MRLDAQLLGPSSAAAGLSPVQVVDRAVALQGQDLGAVLRAIAIRCAPGTTLDDVRAAFTRGELVRSWPMRGTLFATTPSHLADLLSLTSARVHRSTARRRHQLGLDDEAIARALAVAVDALAAAPLTRSGLLAAFEAAGLPTDAGRGYHLIFHLAVGGVVRWGPFTPDGREQMIELAPVDAARAETGDARDADEVFADIARGFVRARGPVTAADLAWWTGLPLTRARRALEAAQGPASASLGGMPAWVGEMALEGAETAAPADGPVAPAPIQVDLVPAFDEWLLGYADRSLVASPEAMAAVIPGGNGVFRPHLLVDGRVVGTWRTERTGRAAGRVQVQILESLPRRTLGLIDCAAAAWPHA